jgi:hypothetical protein
LNQFSLWVDGFTNLLNFNYEGGLEATTGSRKS